MNKTTIEKILSSFPHLDNVSKEALSESVDKALQIKIYYNSTEAIRDELLKLYPRPEKRDYTDGSPYTKWSDWFYKVDKWLYNDYFDLWRKANGDIRSMEEANELCADIWMKRIFYTPLHDNGTWGNTDGSEKTAMLGSLLKSRAMEEITEETKTKAKEGIRDFYAEHPYRELDCDYGPCLALWDILKDAGVPENRIGDICPWKTCIGVERRDHSVCVYGYGKREYV